MLWSGRSRSRATDLFHEPASAPPSSLPAVGRNVTDGPIPVGSQITSLDQGGRWGPGSPHRPPASYFSTRSSTNIPCAMSDA